MIRCTDRPRLILPALALVLGLSGCAATREPTPAVAEGTVQASDQDSGQGDTDDRAHDNLDAVTWLQGSGEYAAVTTGVYAAATRALERLAAEDPAPARGRAVVLDVDETVLDNVAYQAQLVIDDASYASDSWDAWIARQAADPVPGVVEFLNTAQALGFHVAFITNRACRLREGSDEACPQHDETLENLAAIGIETQDTTLMLRGDRPPPRCWALLIEAERATGAWSSDKESRRACVALERDIVMLFGDQLGDFSSALHDATGRQAADAAEGAWGTRWFMLPNPTYGAWKPRSHDEKRSLLRGID